MRRLARFAPQVRDPAWVSGCLPLADLEALILPFLHAFERLIDGSGILSMRDRRIAWKRLYRRSFSILIEHLERRVHGVLEASGVLRPTANPQPGRHRWTINGTDHVDGDRLAQMPDDALRRMIRAVWPMRDELEIRPRLRCYLALLIARRDSRQASVPPF